LFHFEILAGSCAYYYFPFSERADDECGLSLSDTQIQRVGVVGSVCALITQVLHLGCSFSALRYHSLLSNCLICSSMFVFHARLIVGLDTLVQFA
jgi:hypothetical protein